jgi:hypothetical protein
MLRDVASRAFDWVTTVASNGWLGYCGMSKVAFWPLAM